MEATILNKLAMATPQKMETSAALQSRASQEVGKSFAELYTKAGSDPGEWFILRLLSLYTLHVSDWAVYSMFGSGRGQYSAPSWPSDPELELL